MNSPIQDAAEELSSLGWAVTIYQNELWWYFKLSWNLAIAGLLEAGARAGMSRLSAEAVPAGASS